METNDRTTPITGKEGAEIKLDVAAEWTKNHRERHPKGVISQFFGNEILHQILQQPDCLGIRIYYANSKPLNGWQKFVLSLANFLANTEGEKHLIIAGATREGEDQLPDPKNVSIATPNVAGAATTFKPLAATGSGPILGEQAMPCPGAAGCPQNPLTGGK